MRMLVIALTLVLGLSAAHAEDKITPVKLGEAFPDLTLKTTDGKDVTIIGLQKGAREGEHIPMLLVIWCSSCSCCREIDATLEKLVKDYKGKAAIVVVSSNKAETPEKVAAMQKRMAMTFPVYLDPKAEVADYLGAKVTTSAVVLDGEGNVKYRGSFVKRGQNFAADALAAVVEGKKPESEETPFSGCPIER